LGFFGRDFRSISGLKKPFVQLLSSEGEQTTKAMHRTVTGLPFPLLQNGGGGFDFQRAVWGYDIARLV
jgi:hypothetical protein